MIRRVFGSLFAVSVAFSFLAVASPASADHTNPREPLSPTEGIPPTELFTEGEGTWEFVRNFPANPGTDLEFFTYFGRHIYSSSGTLGQADEGHVGQRILRLTDEHEVDPIWWADHGSANCPTNNPGGTTGLQHDVVATPGRVPKLLIDTTDAGGRCHDEAGGGLEFIDVSGLQRQTWEPREIHLTRHVGTSHTVSRDATRPWIIYSNNSGFGGQNWIELLDIRSCLLPREMPLEEKRASCRPLVYRIPFEEKWSQARDVHGNVLIGGAAGCHDVTTRPGRLYCAGLNATLIFDVSELTDDRGNVKGTPLDCPVVGDATRTAAQVTDCSQVVAPFPSAEGWEFLGRFNHPGRDCVPHAPGTPPNTNCNSNNFVESDRGVSVAHEADPTEDGKYVFVTDERGGGVVAPGSSCGPGLENPFGNGGAHVFDITDPAHIKYALNPFGRKAVWRDPGIVPAPTFCDIHVMEFVPGRQRFITAYYTQGTKIVDYTIDDRGRFHFDEVATLILPEANTWAVEPFKIVRNDDGTVTYFLMASDIQRGIDIFTWTGPDGPAIGATAASRPDRVEAAVNVGMVVGGLTLLPVAAWFGRRRRR